MSTNRYKLLAPSVYKVYDNRKKAFITLSGSGGGMLKDVVFGTAPVSGIRVNDGIDYSANKSLRGDLHVVTFGHSPVSIVIDGFDLYSTSCKKEGGKGIQAFFNKYNAHDNRNARVDVGMNHGEGGSVAFRCIVVSLERSGYSSGGVRGVGTYKLMLLGVRL